MRPLRSTTDDWHTSFFKEKKFSHIVPAYIEILFRLEDIRLLRPTL